MPVFNNILAGASAQASGPYHIEHSLSLGRDLTLFKTGVTSTSTYTFSWWAKGIWDHDNNANAHSMGGADTCYAQVTSDRMHIGSGGSALTTAPDHRMHCRSGWYHVCLVGDGTAGNVKLYVNGTLWTTHGSARTIDNIICGGRSTGATTDRWPGYIAEWIFQHGVANDPTTYAETDDNGTWIPKDPSTLTFGANDVWLRFNTSDPTVDSSGNSNTMSTLGTVTTSSTDFWTNNTLCLDTPTNNWCLLDANLDQFSGLVTWQQVGRGLYLNTHDACISGNMPLTSGKWYFEGMVPSTANPVSCMFGLASEDMMYSDDAGDGAASTGNATFGGQNVHWHTNGVKRYEGGGLTSYGSAASTEDIIGIAFDLDNMKIWAAVNNTWIASGDPANGTNPMWDGSSGGNADGHFDKCFSGDTANPAVDDGHRFWAPFCCNTGNEKIAVNFGQAYYNGGQRESDPNAATGAYSFKYTPPSGFKAICTKNLPDVPIPRPEKHVEVKTYDQSTASQNISLEFKPDLLWFHQDAGDTQTFKVTDSCSKKVYAIGDTSVSAPTDCVTSFNISGGNGFVLGADTGDLGINGELNAATTVYAWKGGGEPTATNTAAAGAAQDAGSVKVDGSNGSFAHGTIRADKMSVNTVAGFSIVTYTGTGTAGTLPHGLGRDPNCIMIRKIDNGAGDHMVVWNADMNSSTLFGQMDTENGINTAGSRWNQNTSNLTNNTFSVETDQEVNTSGASYVAFIWAPIAQFSAFGHNHGFDRGGSVPMVDSWETMTGFKPKILMIKRKVAASGHWLVYDNEQDTNKFNPIDSWNYANLTTNRANGFGHAVDFYNNGFKIRNSDGDCVGAADFLWWAWADEPMGGANISPATGQ